jgi:hypothetical protein
MKLLILIFLASCSTNGAPLYPNTLVTLQKCWDASSLECINKNFGRPDKKSNRSIVYLSGQNEFLTIFTSPDHKKIVGIQYWIFPPPKASADEIRKMLPASDWKQTTIPERNPHVVNLAIANHSDKLGAHFLTYKTDKKQEVRVLYWGGNYMNMEF